MESGISPVTSFSLSEKDRIGELLNVEFDSNEEILWIGKPLWSIFIFNKLSDFIQGLLLTVTVFSIIIYIHNGVLNYENLETPFIFFIIVTLGITISTVKKTFNLSKTIYIVTSKCIITHQKKKPVKNKFIHFQYILTKKNYKSLLDKIFQTGTIQIFTGNTEKDVDNQTQKIFYHLYCIKKSDTIFQLIRTNKDHFYE